MRTAAALAGILAVVGGAAAIVWLVPDDAAPTPEPTPSTLLASLGYANPACSLCHYAWQDALNVTGERAEDGTFRVRAEPGGALDVVDVRAVAVRTGRESTTEHVLTDTGEVVLGRSFARRIHIPANSSVVFASARFADEYARGGLAIEIVPPGGEPVVGTSGHPLVHARAVAPEEGEHVVRVTYVNGTRPVEEIVIEWDVGGPGVVPLDDLPQGPVAAWDLPFADARAVLLTYRPFNPHPADRWTLPTWGDLGFYSTLLAVGEPAPLREHSAEEIEAGWAGRDRIPLVDETLSAVVLRARDPSGAWRTAPVYRAGPGPEEAFAAIPPGSASLEARIEWTPSPGSPDPDFELAITLPGDPAFLYPEPTAAGDGFLAWTVPLAPAQWEAFEGTGAFQAFALFRLSEDGTNAFDGEWRLLVEAARGSAG